MEGRFGYVVLTARYFYVTALVHLTKDFDDLIYSVSFLFHVSGRVFARQSLIFNGPVYGGQVSLGEITKTGPLEKLVWAPIKDPDNEIKTIHNRTEDPHSSRC